MDFEDVPMTLRLRIGLSRKYISGEYQLVVDTSSPFFSRVEQRAMNFEKAREAALTAASLSPRNRGFDKHEVKFQ
jgi:hypothetical protein